MFIRNSLVTPFGRTTALAAVAALALTAAIPSAAVAAPQVKHQGKNGAALTRGATDISARRRVAVRHGYRGGGAAAAAAFAGIVGTGSPSPLPRTGGPIMTITMAVRATRPAIITAEATSSRMDTAGSAGR